MTDEEEIAVLIAAGRCVCCAAPAVRLILATVPTCQPCDAGECPRCVDDDGGE